MLEEKLTLKSPLMVQFEITPDCNNNCPFCYNFWQYDKSGITRKSEIGKNSLDNIMNTLAEQEIMGICFTGGEPLISQDSLFELLQKAKERGIYTSMNTNGRLITKTVAEKLKDAGLDSALISLHGDSKEVHGNAVGNDKAFFETVQGIKNLFRSGITKTVNYVATQNNIGRIVPTAKMLPELGIKKMTVTPLLPFPGIQPHKEWAMRKSDFEKYFEALKYAACIGLKVDSTLPVAPCILKEMYPTEYLSYLDVLSPRVCMAGVTFMVVSPKGYARACIQAPQLDAYGDDISQKFKAAWANAHKWADKNLLPDECVQDCYALSVCGGGCRTSSLAQNSSTSGRTMYMGSPISLEESAGFIKRCEAENCINSTGFRKNKSACIRREDFGGVVANSKRQSFVLLDRPAFESYIAMPDRFECGYGNHVISVLYAAGILESAPENSYPAYEFPGRVIHASEVFPRLAGALPIDSKVRMLRADTGERLYF